MEMDVQDRQLKGSELEKFALQNSFGDSYIAPDLGRSNLIGRCPAESLLGVILFQNAGAAG